MHRLAIYDLDKTITRKPSWTPFLLHAARARAPWRLALLPGLGVAGLGYLIGAVDRGGLKQAAQTLMIGRATTPAVMADIATGFASTLVPAGVYPQALTRIAADRAAGFRVVIATASFRFYVAAIAARLGIADVIATNSARDESDAILARIAGENCYGAAKLAMIKAWLAGQGIARGDAEIRFYSDHVSDAPTLAWADEAFAVNPHPPLRSLAEARGWGVLDWR